MIRITRIDPLTKEKTVIAEYSDPEQIEKINTFIKTILEKKKERNAKITEEFLKRKTEEENKDIYN